MTDMVFTSSEGITLPDGTTYRWEELEIELKIDANLKKGSEFITTLGTVVEGEAARDMLIAFLNMSSEPMVKN